MQQLESFQNFLINQAKPETLSITISQSHFVSSSKPLFTISSDELVSIALGLAVFQQAFKFFQKVIKCLSSI